jgi:hypothetical protein
MPQHWKAWTSTCVTLAAVIAVIALATVRASRGGAAYRPQADSELIFELSAAHAAELAKTRGLRAQLRTAAPDADAALRLARAEIESSRATGDLRALGRAEAALAPFTGPAVSAPLLVLRATIQQARHAFVPALADLDAALRLDPGDAQAHLTRASVLGVLGRHAEARDSCTALRELAPPFVATLCSAGIDGYTDQRFAALEAVRSALRETRSKAERAWAFSLLCELSFWGAELEAAAASCSAALQLDPADRYTRALFADVLLEQQRPAEVLGLIAANSQDDALLLRRALAELRLSRPEAAGSVAALSARFARSRARGDRVHQREEARLLLALGREPARALALASEGFAAQHEPWDARLLLEAARASGAVQAATPVQTFMREQRISAELIMRAAARLGSAS